MCAEVLFAIAITFFTRGLEHVMEQRNFVSCMVLTRCADIDEIPEEVRECIEKRLKGKDNEQ